MIGQMDPRGPGPGSAGHDERCRAEARTREERRAETREKHEWKMPQYSLLNFFSCSLRFLSFIRSGSQDSIANGALVIARLQLATGIRPVGRKAHNAGPLRQDNHGRSSESTHNGDSNLFGHTASLARSRDGVFS